MICGVALEDLGENGLRASELDELRILVERDSDGPGLFRERFENCLPDPPHRVRNELDALLRIELSDRF